MGFFSDVVDTVTGFFGGGEEAQKAPRQEGEASPDKGGEARDPAQDIEVQRAKEDLAYSQKALKRTQDDLAKAQQELEMAQKTLADATKARESASDDGAYKVPGTGANRTYAQALKKEEAAKKNHETLTRRVERLQKELKDAETNERQMHGRVVAAETAAKAR